MKKPKMYLDNLIFWLSLIVFLIGMVYYNIIYMMFGSLFIILSYQSMSYKMTKYHTKREFNIFVNGLTEALKNAKK